MQCPFVVVERLSNIARHSYGILKLTDGDIMEQIRSLAGCKMSLFLSRSSINIDAFMDKHNIDVVLCRDEIPITWDLVMYGTALLRRRMPIRLVSMNNVDQQEDTF
jgi:hypothetical protein